MKLGFQIFVLLAAVAVHCADTYCGILDVPTTWTKDNSPYHVTGDIQISPAARLTIEAGVTVLVATGEACGETKQLDWSDSTSISIKAYGPLIIKGTPEEPVVFMPENHVPGKIQWDGIRLPAKNKADVIIEYVRIMGANKALNASFSNFNVGNTLFINNNTGIWMENEADLAIYNCIFTENLSAGVYIKNSRPSIAANIFYKNSNFGIWSDSRPSLRIQNNLFFANADTDCRFCPSGTAKITKKDRAPSDKFGNIFSDPMFAGGEADNKMQKKDIDLKTPAKNTKDTVLSQLYEGAIAGAQDAPLQPLQPQPSPPKEPYRLSKYSPALNAAPKTDFFKNNDGSQGDIGLYGGKPGRFNKPISL